MRLPELPGLHAVGAPEIDPLAVLVELQQSRVGAVDDPYGAVAAEHDVVRLPKIRPCVVQLSVLIENLYAAVGAVRDVDPSIFIDRDAVDTAQLARAIAARAERRHELAVL